jgi:effector-binding domain-containing protein
MACSAVQLQQLPATPVAVIRRQVRQAELSRVVPEGCGIVWNALKAQAAPAGRNVAIYWDGSIRLEVGVELLGSFTESGEVARSATPAGSVAWVTHLGPYGELGTAHRAVLEWCKSHGHRLAGPSWEIYGHWLAAWDKNPAQIRTDIFYLTA